MLLIDPIPMGVRALDGLLKEAPVHLVSAGTVQCGLYLIVISGEVEPVERSVKRALDLAGARVTDHVLLPDAEPRILPAIREHRLCWPAPGDTLGVIQTGTPPQLLRAVDRALKGTPVELVELRVGDGLGGGAIASLWGETHDVEAAIELAAETIPSEGAAGFSTAVIRNADADLVSRIGSPTMFHDRWRG